MTTLSNPTRTTNLMDLNSQWAARPADQRFLSIAELKQAVLNRRNESWTTAHAIADVRALPSHNGLEIAIRRNTNNREVNVRPNHWSFGQVSSAAKAPASYLRRLPAELAAINLQWGLEKLSEKADGLFLTREHADGTQELEAVTSTTYGRIWDSDVVAAVERVNEDGRWKVPSASYATSNPRRATTLYASDRDVWMFLCDEANPIEVDGERLFRGFMVWNSEVGASAFGLKTFLYRHCCDNRIVWGAQNVNSLMIRHTGGAPERFAHEGRNLLRTYAEASTQELVAGIRKAKETVVEKKDEKNSVQSWLRARGFQAAVADAAVKTAVAEEGQARTLWDIVQGITAHARSIENADDRVALEMRAGALLDRVN